MTDTHITITSNASSNTPTVNNTSSDHATTSSLPITEVESADALLSLLQAPPAQDHLQQQPQPTPTSRQNNQNPSTGPTLTTSVLWSPPSASPSTPPQTPATSINNSASNTESVAGGVTLHPIPAVTSTPAVSSPLAPRTSSSVSSSTPTPNTGSVSSPQTPSHRHSHRQSPLRNRDGIDHTEDTEDEVLLLVCCAFNCVIELTSSASSTS